MKPILVASDFSTRSDRALRRATLLAKQTGAPLALLHVFHRAHGEADAAEARILLGDTVRALREVDGVDATSALAFGEVDTGILSTAADIDAGLIVLGPHRARLSSVFTGTTADRLIRRARIPVLVALQTPSAPYARTLLAIDFDAASRNAALAARALGLIECTSVSSVHVFDGAARDPVQEPLARQLALDADARRAWRETRHRLHALVAEMELPSRRARIAPQGGSIARSLLDCATQEAASLIVAGTRNRDRMGFERVLAGSVAQELLREARRDVLIVPEGDGVGPGHGH